MGKLAAAEDFHSGQELCLFKCGRFRVLLGSTLSAVNLVRL